MDGPVSVLLSVFFGLTFGVPLLCFYMWLAFRLGQDIARRMRTVFSLRTSILLICLAWLPPSAIGLLLPTTEFLRGSACLILFLMNAYPTVVGYATERTHLEILARKRFRKNVDDWLSEWECGPPDTLSSDQIRWLLNSNDEETRNE